LIWIKVVSLSGHSVTPCILLLNITSEYNVAPDSRVTKVKLNRNGDLTDYYEIGLLSIKHCNEQNLILEVLS